MIYSHGLGTTLSIDYIIFTIHNLHIVYIISVYKLQQQTILAFWDYGRSLPSPQSTAFLSFIYGVICLGGVWLLCSFFICLMLFYCFKLLMISLGKCLYGLLYIASALFVGSSEVELQDFPADWE